MAHQDVPNTVKAELRFLYEGNNAENVFHIRTSDVPNTSDINAMAASAQTWLEDVWAPLASNKWSANQMVFTSMHNLSGPRVVLAISPAIVGTNTEDALPANSTFAIKANTDTRGRGKSGRTYWCGLSEDQVNGNQVIPATADAIIEALNQLNILWTDVGAHTEGIVIAHYVVGGVRPPTVSTTPVSSYSIADNTIDSQRTRLPNHKKNKRRVP
jgi:hypothetical protein